MWFTSLRSIWNDASVRGWARPNRQGVETRDKQRTVLLPAKETRMKRAALLALLGILYPWVVLAQDQGIAVTVGKDL